MTGKVYDRRQLTVDRSPLKQLAVELGNMPDRDPIDMLEKMVEVFEEFGFDAIEQITGLDLRFLKTILDTIKGIIDIDDWPDLVTLPAQLPAIWLNIIRNFLRPGGVINLDWLDELVGGAGGTPVTLPVTLPFTLPTETTAATWFFTNLKSFLADIDFTSPDFNPVEALSAFVSLALLPLNLLAKLIGGFVPTGQIPGLDASKIISGLFAAGMVSGLPDFLTNVENVLKSIPGGGLLSGVVGFWADFVNSLLGHGPNVTPAYTPANSAVANVQGQINAIQAQISSTGEGAADGFNYPPLAPEWVPIYSTAQITDGGFVWNIGGTDPIRYTCQKFNGAIPDTTLWQVQMTVIFPNNNGAAVFGKSRFGGGANSALDSRFPAVELDVNQFGTFVRLGSLDGPVNDFFLHSAGWVEYGNLNLGGILKNGDVLALECDETNKIYRLYLNPGPGSEPIVSFLDSGNTIARGLGFRYPWFQLNVVNDPFQVGNGWDNFFVFDRV